MRPTTPPSFEVDRELRQAAWLKFWGLLVFVAGVGCFATAVYWMIRHHAIDPGKNPLGGIGCLLIVIGAAMYLSGRRNQQSTLASRESGGRPLYGAPIPERSPSGAPWLFDHLADFTDTPLDCDGVAVHPLFEVVNGGCQLRLLLQNRFANPAALRIVFAGPPELRFDITAAVGGAAYEAIWTPIGVPKALQGARVAFYVTCATEYPHGGRGEMVRPWRGCETPTIDDVERREKQAQAANVLLGLFGGPPMLPAPHGATFTVILPTSVRTAAPEDAEWTTAILWRPESKPPPPARR